MSTDLSAGMMTRGSKATGKNAPKKPNVTKKDTIKVVPQSTSPDESVKRSRKRAADTEAGENATAAAKEAPAKKTRTTKSQNLKPSKVDGHPVDVVKDVPSGDKIEVEPSRASRSKRGKAAAQDKTKTASTAEEKPATVVGNEKPIKGKGSRARKTDSKASAPTARDADDATAPTAQISEDTSIQEAAENLLEAASDNLSSAFKKAEAVFVETATDQPAAVKGRKRKAAEEPTTVAGTAEANPDAEVVPSAATLTKKQKKTKSTLGNVATALSDGLTSILSSMSSAVGAKSIAEDVTTVVKDVVETKNDAKKQGKGKAASQKGKLKSQEATVEAKEEALAIEEVEPDGDDEWEPDDQTANLIKGFESEEDEDQDSCDEDFKDGKDIPKRPNKRGLVKKLKNAGKTDEPGVIYVGRIPHGFHEHEMRSYFSQFGDVNHVRLSRSKKTGRSKHYAFLEFASSEVAKIVAETMNNYLLFGHILKCSVIPKEQINPNLWIGADRRLKSVPWAKIERRKLSLPKGRAHWNKKVETERSKREDKANKVKEIMGYDIDPTPVKGTETVPVVEGKLEKSKLMGKPRGKAKAKELKGDATDKPEEVLEKTLVVAEEGQNGAVVVSEELKVRKGGRKRKVQYEEAGSTLEDAPVEQTSGTNTTEQKLKPKAAAKTKVTKPVKEQALISGADIAEVTTGNKVVKKPSSKKAADETSKDDTSKPSTEGDSEPKEKASRKTSKKVDRAVAGGSTSKAIESVQAKEQVEESKTGEKQAVSIGGEERSSPKRTPKPSKRALEMAEFAESVKRPRRSKK